MLPRLLSLCLLASAASAQLVVPPAGRPFLPRPAWPNSTTAGSCLAIDINNDGYPDAYDSGGGEAINNGHGLLFEVKATLPAGITVAGDLDGDGRIDLAVSPFYPAPSVLGTWLGDGEGGFTAQTTHLLGEVSSLALADFDEDGALDVVAGHDDPDDPAGSVYVLLNDGAGRVGAPVVYGADGLCRDIATGDYDQDGHADVLAAILPTNERLMLGDGHGALADGPLQLSGGGSSNQLADVDADGWLDVLALHIVSYKDKLVLTLNDHGALPSEFDKQWFPLGYVGFTTADLAGDGLPDLVAGTQYGWLYTAQNTTGLPGPLAQVQDVGDNSSVAAADFDGDGRLDVLASGYYGFSAHVLFGDGAGGLLALESTVIDGAPSSLGPMRLLPLDGDARKDLVLLDSQHDQMLVALATGPAAWGPFTPFALGDAPHALNLVDLDGDGATDVVAGVSNGFASCRGDGLGGFLSAQLSPNFMQTVTLVLGDLDGDGHPDLVRSRYAPFVTDVLEPWLGDGAGGFHFTGTGVVVGDSNGVALQLGDFDQDGDLDVADLHGAGTNDPQGTLRICAGDGHGGLGALTLVPQQLGLSGSLTAADVDGDGHLDLAVTCKLGGSVALLRGLGDGSFASPLVVGPANSYPGAVTVADADGDGVLDLVFPLGDTSCIATGDGAGGLRPAQTYSSGMVTANGNIEVADVDDDGRPDLVALANGDGRLVLLRGVGDGKDAWTSTGGGVPSSSGQPRSVGIGTPVAGQPIGYAVDFAPPSTPGAIVVGTSLLATPFKGGLFVPHPDLLLRVISTSPAGSFSINSTWPAGLPSDGDLWVQTWFPDASAISGYSATGGLRLSVP